MAKAAAAANPLNPQILDTLGTVHLALGDAEAAVPVLAESVRRGGACHSGTPRTCSGRSGNLDQARLTLSAAKARDDAQGDDFEALVKEVESNLTP